jgi:peptidyl-prolyl cis-trans isomerase B (cyclophilin B)
VPGKDRQRALARAKLERQMARRAEAARRRRRINATVGAVLALVLVAGGIYYLVQQVKETKPSTAAQATAAPSAQPSDSASAAASPAASPAAGTCVYAKAPEGAAKNVGVPGSKDAPRAGTQTATIDTNVGTLKVTLDLAKAPCTTHSFAFLAGKKYFDGTPCHRLTTSSIFVLQCGDPTGTGSGGPGYQFGEENLPSGNYPAGTLAMANAGAGTNGSQFFIVYKDTQLPPNYTIFGKVTSGLDVVQKVAAAGVQGGSGDGKPNQSVTLTHVTVS